MTRSFSILTKEKLEYPILVYTLYTEIRDHKSMALIFPDSVIFSFSKFVNTSKNQLRKWFCGYLHPKNHTCLNTGDFVMTTLQCALETIKLQSGTKKLSRTKVFVEKSDFSLRVL